MTRALTLIALIATLAACTGNPPKAQNHGLDQNRNWPPQSSEPGLSISGYADVGVVRTF